jgi:hypothetical protein
MIHVLRQRISETRLPVRWLFWLAVAAAALLIVPRLFPSLTPERTAQASVDWSRGTRLGEAVNSNPIALWVDRAGGRVVAVSSRWEGDEQVLHYAALDRAGDVLAEHDLTINLAAPRQAQVLAGPNGEPVLFFTALHNISNERALFQVSLDAAGNPRQAPTLVSEAGSEVAGFVAVVRGDRLQAFWSAVQGDVPSVYMRAFDPSGKVLGPVVLVAQRAEGPDARVDKAGMVHLVWVDVPPGSKSVRSLYYATIPPDADLNTAPEGTRIANAQGASSDNVWGPVLGLTTGNVYALWGIERVSGQSAGAAEAYYVSAPFGKVDFTAPSALDVPDDPKVNYGTYAGSLHLGQLAPLEPGRSYFNGAILYFVTPRVQLGELPVALSMNVLRGFNPVSKIALVLFADGRPKGYAIAGQTDQGASFPSLAADPSGDLFVTWFDQGATGTRNATVYFAATTAEAKAHLDPWTPQDVVLSLVNSVWGMTSGLGVIPLALAWGIPGLAFATIVQIIRVDGEMSLFPEKIAMGAAVAIYFVIKMTLLPGLFSYVPFSAWVPLMPALLATVLRVATPVFILIFALGASYYLIVKTGQRQLLWMYIFFAIADTVPTMLLYGPSFLGQ